MARSKKPGCLRRRRSGGLDRLCLVENRVVAVQSRENCGVATKRSVRRENDVDLAGVYGIERATSGRIVEESQLRLEASGFASPVEHERPRNDDQRRDWCRLESA